VISRTTARFWECFHSLPSHLQQAAREKYELWQADPFHPSLHFKELAPDLWSVRINIVYRALARRRGDLVVWFWIGTHEQYDRLIDRMK
jgi:hypothetical protein